MIDPPEPDLRETVMRRDKCCFGYRMVQDHQADSHECRDQWDHRHLAHDTKKLTLDHVWPEFAGGVRGKKAPTDQYHLVAVCHWMNVSRGGSSGITRVIREAERRYLRGLYPEHYKSRGTDD